MKLPIPQDWDGETWECYQIQWPVSIEYRAILIGFLSFMTRGRAWDERSGTILEAQQIAWDIFDRNSPLLLCQTNDNGGTIPIPVDSTGATYALVDWSEIMGIFVTGAHWESGKLVLEYGPCCEKSVLDGANMNGEAPTVDDLTGDNPPSPEVIDPEWFPPEGTASWACRKAWALGKAWEDLMLALIAAVDMDPFSGVSYIKAQLPYVDMSSSRAAYLLAGAQVWERALPLTEMQWDSEKTEAVICETARGMVDGTSAMTADEFAVFFSAIERQAGTLYMFAVRDFYTAFERSRWRQVISSGIFDDTADCTCPEQAVDYFIPIAGYEWIVALDWTDDDWGFSALAEGAAHTSWELGVGWKYTVGEVIHAGINIATGNEGPGDITYMRHEYSQMFTTGRAYGPTGLKLGGTTKWYDATLSLCPPPRLYHTREFSPAEAFVANTSWEWTIGQIQKVDNVWSGEIHFTRTIIAGTGTCPWPANQVYP